MAAVDFLPIAQSTARPDPAAERKPATASNEEGETSFAEVLEAEVESTPELEAAEETAAPDQIAGASAQPGPPPATLPVNTGAAAPAAIAAIVSAPMLLQTQGDASDAGSTTRQAASGPAPAPAIKPDGPAPAAPAPPAPAASPAVAATPDPEAPAAAPVVDAPIAPATPTTDSVDAQPVSSDADGTAKATVKADGQAVTADLSAQPQPDASPEAATSTADEHPTLSAKPAQSPSSAPAVVAASPASDVAVQVVASSVGGQALHAKPVAPATPSENAPGQRRKTAGETNVAAMETSATNTRPGAQPAQPGTAPAQPSGSQAKSPAQLANAEAALAEVKAEGAPAPSASASTSSGQTSFADALAAARGQAADAGRPQVTNPHLQSAPAAAVQVYARFVERFDGRAQRFDVRLDPAELGRVDVRIEIGADKKVHAVLAAHDSAALTDLMRGQRALERALSDAGIDLADNGLRFELSQDSGRNLTGQQRDEGWSNEELAHAWRGFSTVEVAVEAGATDAAATRSYPRRSSRLDLVA